jgi:hypothetical protein
VHLAVGDVDGGSPDIVVACDSGTRMTVLSGGDDGTFAPGPDVRLPAAMPYLALANVDGANHDDVIAVDQTASSLTVFQNDGTGGFRTVGQYPVINGYVRAHGMGRPSGHRHRSRRARRPLRRHAAERRNRRVPDVAVVHMGEQLGGIAAGDTNGVGVDDFAVNDDASSGSQETLVRPCPVDVPWLLRDDSIASLAPTTPTVASLLAAGSFTRDGAHGVPTQAKAPIRRCRAAPTTTTPTCATSPTTSSIRIRRSPRIPRGRSCSTR